MAENKKIEDYHSQQIALLKEIDAKVKACENKVDNTENSIDKKLDLQITKTDH